MNVLKRLFGLSLKVLAAFLSVVFAVLAFALFAVCIIEPPHGAALFTALALAFSFSLAAIPLWRYAYDI